MQESIAQILRKVRLDRGLSQENVADVLKIDATTYGRYEKSDSQIKFDQVAQIASFYKLTLDELYHYGDPDWVKPDSSINLSRVQITVALDGRQDTLERCVQQLTAINVALNQIP